MSMFGNALIPPIDETCRMWPKPRDAPVMNQVLDIASRSSQRLQWHGAQTDAPPLLPAKCEATRDVPSAGTQATSCWVTVASTSTGPGRPERCSLAQPVGL